MSTESMNLNGKLVFIMNKLVFVTSTNLYVSSADVILIESDSESETAPIRRTYKWIDCELLE